MTENKLEQKLYLMMMHKINVKTQIITTWVTALTGILPEANFPVMRLPISLCKCLRLSPFAKLTLAQIFLAGKLPVNLSISSLSRNQCMNEC